MVGGITSGISNISSLQASRALNAFKKAAQADNQTTKNNINDIGDVAEVDGKQYKSNGSSVSEKLGSSQKQKFIEEFKKFTQQYNQMGISDAEILSALKYGNSVLVNQVC